MAIDPAAGIGPLSLYNAGGAGSFGNVAGSVQPGGSRSSSQSTSFIPGYAEEPFLNAIAQHAGAVGDQVYNWAQQAYNNTTANTNANIGNFYGVAGTALNNANTYNNAYLNNAIPGIRQQFADASRYASPDRILSDMGAAESAVNTAGAANHANTVRDLESYGLNTGDPSSGRYAALDKAEAVQNAATEAQAGYNARNQDITMGRNLLNNAVTNSQPLLGASNAALNTGTQNFTAAENAALGNANVGATLQQTANPYFQTASSLKYPPLGQQAQSTSASQSYPPISGGGGGGSKSPSNPTQPQQGSGTPGSDPAYAGGLGASVGGGSSGSGSNGSPPPGSSGGTDTSGSDPYAAGGDLSQYAGDPFSSGSSDPYSYDGSGGYDTGGLGDPYTSAADPYAAATDQYYGGLSDASSYGNDTGGSYDYTGSSNADMSGSYSGDYSAPDTSSFAEGGDVGGLQDDPTTGGYVPPTASPSQGQQTDDVNANLNAGEFVVPKDVAAWKGQEFFQKLIMQARKARAMSPAHPQPGPARPGPANFASRPMR